MRDLANVLKVTNIQPITGKDRIELATIENWEVIVGKGDYVIGDLVIYVEYDTVLPIKPEFEFLRARCYSKKYDGFRIKNLKMAGVFSQGIVFPTSILPPTLKIKEGVCVAKDLGIRKYDPEEFVETTGNTKKRSKLLKFLMKFKFFRKIVLRNNSKEKAYPETVSKSDETNIQKLFNWLHTNLPNEVYYKSEKVEGQAATYMLLGKRNHYQIYSHNAKRSVGDGSDWDKVSKKYSLEKILKIHYKTTKQRLAIQGEIAGPGIQGNIYNFTELTFFVYGLIDTDTGKRLMFEELESFCWEYTLTMVPIYSRACKLPETLKEVLDESNGLSVLTKNVKREGIVWRSIRDSSIGFKAKSPEYLAKLSKREITE